MRKLIIVTAVFALLCIGGIAQATPIQGSTTWGIFGDITTVNNHTFIMPQPTAPLTGMFTYTGFGDFAVVPGVPPMSNLTWLTSNTLDVYSPAGWTFGSEAFGTWLTTGGTYDRVYYNGVQVGLNASLQGTFNPGTMFNGPTQNQGVMSLGFIMSGNTATNVSGSMAMNPVPEPGTICAALSILGPVGFVFRRKRS